MQPSPKLPSERIGKYRLLAHIATGGMGTVYKAQDEQLDRIVALKVLAPELAANPVLVERFRREARNAAQLVHRNIVTLYECGQADGVHYLALEFVEGMDLAEYIRRKGQLDSEEARRILMQACKALDHAFTQGITHRDIKPSNFLLAIDEGRARVKLTDLGLSRMEGDEEHRVTRAGTTVGTVDYMAPEQARDSGMADIRSDIYSLGCTLYHMLAGQPPFNEGGLGERVLKHIQAEPPDVRLFNSQVSTSLWLILRKMLAKSPDQRYQTPGDLFHALRNLGDQGASALGDGDADDTADDRELTPQAATQREFSRPAEPPPPSSAETPVPRSGRKRSRPAPVPTIAEDGSSAAMLVSPEQRQAASLQYERACEARDAGNMDYAQELLLTCCKVDPSNLQYRKTLRDVVHTPDRKPSSWFSALTTLPLRSRLKAARTAGDHRKVLDHGEELLMRAPDDIGVQLDMAASAEALNLQSLAVWLLEQARATEPDNIHVMKALALLHERHRRFSQAIQLWEKVRKADPSDHEASQKIRNLAASDTIARSRFRR